MEKRNGPKKTGGRRHLRRAGILLAVLAAAGLLFLAGTNGLVAAVGGAGIRSAETLPDGQTYDCVLVLGAGVREDGHPSDMLVDRLRVGVSLYKAGAAPKLLMSGDHGSLSYDEVGAMRQYALDEGVPSEDIFMDHAGFSTYESMFRAREVFACRSILIVSQGYHLYRAVYDAQALGLEAVGVPSDLHTYLNQWKRDVREVLARTKDVLWCLFRPEPTYLGEQIPISGSGEATLG